MTVTMDLGKLTPSPIMLSLRHGHEGSALESWLFPTSGASSKSQFPHQLEYYHPRGGCCEAW